MVQRNPALSRDRLNTKQAKDFLVGQTVEQAALEGVPFADLEKRMMYFTESDPASCDNPIELNYEFEAQYETKEYEIKISRLLHHAYARLKEEDPERARNWEFKTFKGFDALPDELIGIFDDGVVPNN